jgi:thymidylate synthase
MNQFDTLYKNLVGRIVNTGPQFESRGEKTIYLFNQQLIVDISCGFPALTLRNVFPNSAIAEAHWDLNGNGKIAELTSPGLRKMWKQYENEYGYVPNTYAKSLRTWPASDMSLNNPDTGKLQCLHNVDQMANAMLALKSNSSSRNIVIQIGNPTSLQGLPTCQTSMTFSSNNGYLDLSVFIRSQDVLFGLPSDIIRYSTYLSVMSLLTGLKVRWLAFTMVNCHIYLNNLDDAIELLKLDSNYSAPTVDFVVDQKIDFDFDFKVTNYNYNKFKLNSQLVVGNLDNYSI